MLFQIDDPYQACAFAVVYLLGGENAELRHIWVDKAVEGKGIGPRLLAQVVTSLQGQGRTRLYTCPVPGTRKGSELTIEGMPTDAPEYQDRKAHLLGWLAHQGFRELSAVELIEAAGIVGDGLTWVKDLA